MVFGLKEISSMVIKKDMGKKNFQAGSYMTVCTKGDADRAKERIHGRMV